MRDEEVVVQWNTPKISNNINNNNSTLQRNMEQKVYMKR